jgi:hypothetical protein
MFDSANNSRQRQMSTENQHDKPHRTILTHLVLNSYTRDVHHFERVSTALVSQGSSQPCCTMQCSLTTCQTRCLHAQRSMLLGKQLPKAVLTIRVQAHNAQVTASTEGKTRSCTSATLDTVQKACTEPDTCRTNSLPTA